MGYLISNLLALVGLCGLLYLSGYLVDLLLGRGVAFRPVALTGRWAAGAALWIGLLFALAAAGLFGRGAVAAAMVAVLLATASARRWWSPANAPRVSSPGRPEAGTLLLAAAVSVVLAALWLHAQWPELSWDAEVYHLTVPRLYLEHGGFRRIPFNVYSNWPLNVELLFGLALLVKDQVLAKLLHFAFGCVTLAVVYRLAAGLRGPWTGWAAVLLLLANPVVQSEFAVAYVDLAFALFFLLGFLFVHLAAEETMQRRQRLLMAGIFSGIAAGIKPTGLAAPLCLMVLWTGIVLRRGEGLRGVLGGGMRLLVPAMLLLLPWLGKSWLLTGNPVYPFLYEQFGGPEWSAELGSQLRSWQLEIGMGREWSDYLLLPLRVILAGDRGYEHFDGRLLPFWILLIPLALWTARREPLVRRSLWLAALYFVIWALSSQQMRFLIAILPLLAVSGAVACDELIGRLPQLVTARARLASSVVLVGLLLVADLQLLPRSWTLLGEYVRYGSAVKQVAVRPDFEFIERELPETARLLFLNTNHGFFCPRDYIADSFFEASQINALMQQQEDKDGIRQLLNELGVSHLLIENRDRYVPWPRSLFDFLNDPDYARLLFRSPDSAHDVVEIVDDQ